MSAGLLATGLVLAGGAPASAHSSKGCTFDVPRPTFNWSTQTAGFKVTMKCGNLGMYGDRQAVVDLREDDGSRTQYITHGVKRTKSAGTYTIWASGVKCNYDRIGKEELYVNARIETRLGGQSYWSKGPNYRGATISVPCK